MGSPSFETGKDQSSWWYEPRSGPREAVWYFCGIRFGSVTISSGDSISTECNPSPSTANIAFLATPVPLHWNLNEKLSLFGLMPSRCCHLNYGLEGYRNVKMLLIIRISFHDFYLLVPIDAGLLPDGQTLVLILGAYER